jgi:hypothetical protein
MNSISNITCTPTNVPDHTACPTATHPDHDSAHIVASHHDQGWILLCNGVVVFDDTGELFPDRHSDAPHRPEVHLGAQWDTQAVLA